MIDHVSLRVQDLSRAVAFYRAALAPLGYDVLMEFPSAVGMGAGKPYLWITQTESAVSPAHLAFAAERARIDAFHAAALAAGATDNGAPGVRADYHPHYYAAYIYDPEGNNIEVVCHDDPDAPKAKLAPARAAARRAARKPAKRAGKAAAKKATATRAKPAKKASLTRGKKKRR
jgi:catechol 2,3-dioxygenase-like lactoylglutathione lyase family enzyme